MISVEKQLLQSPQLMGQLLVRDELTLYLLIYTINCFSMSVAGSDYTSISMNVTFAAGSTMATFRVNISDDTDIEGDEMFTTSLTSSDSNIVTRNNTATVTILDKDGNELSFTHTRFKHLFQL